MLWKCNRNIPISKEPLQINPLLLLITDVMYFSSIPAFQGIVAQISSDARRILRTYRGNITDPLNMEIALHFRHQIQSLSENLKIQFELDGKSLETFSSTE